MEDYLVYGDQERTADKMKREIADLLRDYFNGLYSMGISKKNLCKYLNISQSKLRLWCSGKYNFTLGELSEVTAKLKVVPCLSFTSSTDSYAYDYV